MARPTLSKPRLRLVSNVKRLRSIDPSRTATLRRQYATDLNYRFATAQRQILDLVVASNAFKLGQVTNAEDFTFQTSPNKLETFRRWVVRLLGRIVLDEDRDLEDAWFTEYARQGYEKGAGRAFDDTRPQVREALRANPESVQDFYRGTKEEFLRSAFGRPVSVERLKLLASRNLTELKGVTDKTAGRLTHILTDGLVQGDNPRVVGRRIVQEMGRTRIDANRIARSEIIRAHAQGQLMAFREMGVEGVGVMAELSTAGDDRVCEKCDEAADGTYTLDEAEGLLPIHPQCRCAFVASILRGRK